MTLPIINLPQRQGRARRTFFQMLTAMAWVAYLYLWLPLLTLLAWAVGMRTAYGLMYQRTDAVEPFLLLALPLIAAICGIVLLGWAEYNRARFGGEERRQPMPAIGDPEVALVLGADAATADTLRGNRIVVLTLDEHARPTAALARPLAPPVPA